MRIGIVSDTHGHTRRLQRALAALAGRGAEAVVHCGDVGSADCLRLLAAAGVPAYAVSGNMDRRPGDLAAAARGAGVAFSREILAVALNGGEHLAATHGDNADLLEELIRGGQFRYVCHGHTHRARDERVGRTRVINPGALKMPRSPHHPTVALLDTDADTVELISV